jgi:hypothetical protein
MKNKRPTAAADFAALGVIDLAGDISAAQARALLKLHFSESDVSRMRELSAKAQAGTLTAKETVQIEAYERFGCLLDVVHSTARRVLKRRKSAS